LKSVLAVATNSSPSSLGFRVPAEWEPQEALLLSWPVSQSTWPGHFEGIPGKFAEIATAISRFQKVRINCEPDRQAEARRLLEEARADMDRVEFLPNPTNDCWCRDHGPIFVKNDRTGEVAVTDWEYNSWGGKYPPYDKDNAIPRLIAEQLGLRRFEIPMVLEGGSIEVDGLGQLLTTEACLLNPNRNPHLNRDQIEQRLRENLGIDRILWLHDGIIGDDTDGHIDDLARFYRPDAIVTIIEENEQDENFPILQDNWERLKDFRTREGKRFELRTLPMPSPVFCEGERLPASYANYLVINGAVLLPVFRQPETDGLAGEILQDCFPGRKIVPIDCVDLVLGLGALHCISQQQPS
jgi:agmatine deiminase